MNKKYGIVSGYFNPLHAGHLEYINSAKKDCEYLIAIVNNDLQVELKNSHIFMDQEHRLNIIQNLKSVDSALIAIDQDKSVVETLKFLRDILQSNIDLIFYNSGDRVTGNTNIKEDEICNELGIQIKILHLPKIYSSSNLVNSVYNNSNLPK